MQKILAVADNPRNISALQAALLPASLNSVFPELIPHWMGGSNALRSGLSCCSSEPSPHLASKIAYIAVPHPITVLNTMFLFIGLRHL